MFKFQGRGHNDDKIPSLQRGASIAREDEAVKGKTVRVVNGIDDDIPGDGDIPDLAPCAAPDGNNNNDDNGVIPDRKPRDTPGSIKTFSDALARIRELERQVKSLKQQLAKDESYQMKNLQLEHQVQYLTEENVSGKDMSNRRQANKHAGKVVGRGHAKSAPASTPSRKKDERSISYRYTVPKLDARIMTADDILFCGLSFVGFGEGRQRVVIETSVHRFKAHYGPEPRTVKDLMLDLCNDFPDTTFKELLMGLNWLKLYDIESVLAGRWKYDESVCRDKCRETTRRIQSFKERLIVFDSSIFRPEEIHINTVDCVNFITQEFRLDPHTKWFDHKSHSSGLKYEFAISVWQSRCVWINGPYPAGLCHDKALFCGTKSMEEPPETWNRDALLFQIPDGKKAIADSAYEGLPEKVTVKRPGHTANVFRFLDRAQNRQETYHSRLENYNILYHRFRHEKNTEDKMDLHKMAVDAVAVIVEYDMKYHPLFQVI